jgi:hypothetical protein
MRCSYPFILLALIAVLIGSSASSAQAQGHAADVHPTIVEGKLTTDRSVYADAFDDFGGFLFTENPGYQTADGVLQVGDQLGFAVVDRLWFWNGEALAEPPEESAVSISRGPLSVTIDGASEPQPGFTLATSAGAGFIHVHPTYTLETAEAVAGVYGLVLQLTAPQYEASDPFVVALGYFGGSLTADQYNAGVEAIGLAALQPPLPGDANLDGKVDLSDFGILKENFGVGTARAQGDFNADGQVDLSDFGILKENFGRGAAAAVPEPATLGLITIAASLFVFTTRRRAE